MGHPYNPNSIHPFPTLPIVITQLEGSLSTELFFTLLDTGADITLIPAEYLQAIQSDELYTANLRMHWGEPQQVGIHLVDIDIDDHRLPGVEVIADDYSDQAILGRNVLNKLILLLDGTARQTDILERRPTRF